TSGEAPIPPPTIPSIILENLLTFNSAFRFEERLSTDEGTSSKPGVPDVPSDESEEEISWNSFDDEDVNDQDKGRHDDEGEKNDESDADDDDDQDDAEKDDADDDDDDEEEIAKLDEQEDTESDDEDDGNGEEDQGLRIREEERIQEEEEADELYRDVDINQGRGLQVSQHIEDSHETLTLVYPDGQQESSSVSSFVTSMLNPTTDAGVESIFTTASSTIAPLPTPTPIMTPSTIATITTSSDAPIPLTTIPNAILENLPTFDLVFRFEDRVKSLEVNFSKFMQTNQFAEAVSKIPDKTILESYGDTTILKRRREDDDDQEGSSAGSDRGSKRQREGGEPESASTLSEPATRSASRSTTWTQSRQMSASESTFAKEPMQTTYQMDEPPHTVFEIDFSNFIMNRLGVDTLTPELLVGPTLMRIDELHKFNNGTLNDVRNALDDRLKGIRMQYLPQAIWRNGDKDRTAAMIQSIDKMLKTQRIMRSLEQFQSLLSQLETRGAGVSTEDANQKFLSTNEVNIVYGCSTSSGHNLQKEGSSSYTGDLIYSFFANQSSGPQLDHDDLEQVDEFDLEKMNLKWHVAMISTRLKKFYKKTGRKLNFDAKKHVGFDKSKDEHKAMVTVDEEGVDWTRHAEDETEDYALMAYNSSNSGSDTEMSAKDKSGLGSSDVEDSPVNDRFAKFIGMHAVPPHMIGNYMPPKSDFGIDESKFTYDPKQSSTSESNAKTSDLDSCDSNSSVETLESIPKPVENEPKAISEPKVWSDAPIIKEYESDSDDEHVTIPSKELENLDNPHQTLKGKGIIDSECFRHMTRNKAYLVDYQDFNGGPVAFGGKFAEKSDEGFLVGYSLSSKAFKRIKLTTLQVQRKLIIVKVHNMILMQEILTWKITMLKNTIYCHYGLLILQLSRSKVKNGDENLNANTDSKTNEESVDKEDQAFLEELERLKRQEKKAIDATETFRKTFAQSTEDLLLQGGAARTSSTKFIQKVWILVDLPFGKKAIRTKWVYRNKKDEKGVVVRNKARLVAQGHRQEEGIDNDEEMYVSQPPGFIDPKFLNKVYKVVKALYGLHQAPRAWYATLSTFLVQSGYRRGLIDKTLLIKKDKKDIMLNRFQMSSMGELTFFLGLQVKQKKEGIFISQDKYVAEILKKFDFLSVKTASTLIETKKPLFVLVLGLWYPRESAFDLEAYSDSDYARANLDRKSTIGGCQFIGRRLISWQCKKQTFVATSTTEVEYVAAASCCGQFWKIATFKTINNISETNAKVSGKLVVITEASIRSDLLFNDADRIDCLTNEAIFENLALMGYEGDLTKLTFQKALFSPQWKFLIHTIIHCLSSKRDHLLLTESSLEHDTSQDPRVNLEGTRGNGGDMVNLPHDSPLLVGHTSDRAEGSLNLEELSALCTNLSNRVLALETIKDAQAKKILTLKARIKKLEKSYKPSISHHRAWLRSMSLLSKKKKLTELDKDMEYIDTVEVVNEERQSTVDTTRPDVSTARPNNDTVGPDVSTARKELSTASPTTPLTTTTIFDDEEMTLTDTLIKFKDDKAKGVAFKDSEDTDRPARSILTLKPLPTIDPNDKGKGVLEEPEPIKKMTKKVERERQREEQASMNYIENLYDEVQARIDADHELAVRLTHEEQEKFVPIRSEEDERRIGDMNKKAEEESGDKGMDNTKKRKAGSRMKTMSKRQKTDVDLEEEEELKTFLEIDPDGEGIIDYEILILEDGTEIHLLAERRYPLTTRTLERMLSLRLIAESVSDAAYDLLRFIQKQIDESGGYDRGEKDL
nr:hypothetical protein [Tanacetum cinerariifolium]